MTHIFPVFLAACILEVGLTIGLLRWASRRRYKKFLLKMFTEDYASGIESQEFGCVDTSIHCNHYAMHAHGTYMNCDNCGKLILNWSKFPSHSRHIV